MKSLTKKVLSLAMAIAMAGSCMAFASDVTIDGVIKDETKEIVDDGTTTVKIPYTTDETEQVTVIVYKVEAKNTDELPANDTIGFINQFDAPTSGSDEVTFTMRDDFVANGAIKDGIYKIIMGGTSVGVAEVAYLVVGEEEVTVVPGDVFVDNIINSNDVTKIVDSLISGIALEGNEFIAADVYTDSIINSNDVTKIVDSLISGATLTFGK